MMSHSTTDVPARSAPSRLHPAAFALLVALCPLSSGASAQTAPVTIDAEALARADAQRQLTGALARIAADGSDGQALSEAGRAALALGDARAAVGFLVRAEALSPRDPVIKAALGGAMVQLEDPAQAMRYFESAIAAGGLDRTYLADRGLAFDLLGDQRRAQADYAVAQASAPSAELTRRWAVSLGISGRVTEAVQMLAPLLRGQDRAAWRSRAMILAMNGRADEARQIARQTLPAELAEALNGYFPLMDRLTPAQLAAASHFGRFPGYETVRNQPSRSEAVRLAAAAAAPPPVATPPAGRSRDRNNSRRDREASSSRRNSDRGDRRTGTRNRATVATTIPPPAPTRVQVAADAVGAPPPPPSVQITQRIVPSPVAAPVSVQTPATSIASPTAVAGPPNTGDTRPGFTANPVVSTVAAAVPLVDTPAASVPAASSPAATQSTVVTGWSLADVVQSVVVPEAERAASAEALSMAEIERIAQEQRDARAAAAEAARLRVAEQNRARADAETRRRAEVQAEERAEQQRLRAHPARVWVQIATGSPVSALAGDYRRLTRRFPQQFEGQSVATAPWNRANRLLVGPFRNAAAARAWDSAYRAAGGQSFIWNSDVGEEVTPLPRR
jgi:Flp pilus assembly protein TadD